MWAAPLPEERLWFVGLCATLTAVAAAVASVVAFRLRGSSGGRFTPTLAAVLVGGCAGALLAQYLFGQTPGGKQFVLVFLGALAAGCVRWLIHRRQRRPSDRVENVPRRRWFQFTLGSLLGLIVIASVVLSLCVRGPIKRRQIASAIELSGGGHVRYVSQTPEWVVGILGDVARGFFDEVDEIRFDDATDDDIARSAIFTRLRSLTVGGDSVTDRALEKIVHFQSLEELQLTSTRITSKGLAQLRRLPQLKSLTLPESTNDDGLKEVGTLTGLESLSMMGGFRAPGTRPKLWGPLTSAGWTNLGNLKELKELYLGQLPIGDDEIAFVENLIRLRRLEIPNASVADAGLRHLQRLQQLEYLNLMNNCITGTGFAELDSLVQLQRLDLGGTPLSDQGLEFIATYENLSMLNLCRTKITDDGLTSLKRLPKLTWLILSGTAVTDDGLASIKELKRLINLDVSRTAVTDAGVQHLELMANLGWLDPTGTKITPAGMRRLEATWQQRRARNEVK